MRFLADMGVPGSIIVQLRQRGHDAVHLREQDLQRLPDDEIFQKAIAENRILLTSISVRLSHFPGTKTWESWYFG